MKSVVATVSSVLILWWRASLLASPTLVPASTDPCPRSEVAEVLASVDGENDGADWIGLFRMKDGRFLVAQGGCDYTGWDCHANNNLTVFATIEDAVKFGLNDSERARLEV